MVFNKKLQIKKQTKKKTVRKNSKITYKTHKGGNNNNSNNKITIFTEPMVIHLPKKNSISIYFKYIDTYYVINSNELNKENPNYVFTLLLATYAKLQLQNVVFNVFYTYDPFKYMLLFPTNEFLCYCKTFKHEICYYYPPYEKTIIADDDGKLIILSDEDMLKFNNEKKLPKEDDRNYIKSDNKFSINCVDNIDGFEVYKKYDDIYNIINNNNNNSKYSVVSNEKIWKDIKQRKLDELLYMPEEENHPIDPERAQKWIDFQCSSNAKAIAQYMIKNTTYISWKVFYENCKIVFDKLYKQLDGKTYCIFFPNEMSNVNVIYKSNYWVTLLLFDYFKTKEYNLPNAVIICNKTNITFKEPYLFDYYVAIDDCSYSGGQMFHEYIHHINNKIHNLIITLPFISSKARDTYYSNNIINSTLIYSSVMYNFKSTIILNENKQIPLQKFYKSMEKYFPNTREIYRGYNESNYPYYFDHKIGDYVSSFPSIYHSGIIRASSGDIKHNNLTTNNAPRSSNRKIIKGQYCLESNNSTYVFYPFVKGCYNPRVTIKNLNDVAKELPYRVCIEPFYKKKYIIPDCDKITGNVYSSKKIEPYRRTLLKNKCLSCGYKFKSRGKGRFKCVNPTKKNNNQ
mgnify:FL=1